MNVQSTYIWERTPGEEIELRIGGEYTPAGRLTEYDSDHAESVTLDWAVQNGHDLGFHNFTPAELDAMRSRLMDAARQQIAGQKKFGILRGILSLPAFDAKQDFIG